MRARGGTDRAATSLRGRLRAEGGGLRNFGVGAPDAELRDAASERVRVQAEDPRRPARALDDPPRPLERGAHVARLDISEDGVEAAAARLGRWRRSRGLVADALAGSEQIGPDLERRSGRQNDRALDDVLQLAHVAGPRVTDEPVHRLRWDVVGRLAGSR